METCIVFCLPVCMLTFHEANKTVNNIYKWCTALCVKFVCLCECVCVCVHACVCAQYFMQGFVCTSVCVVLLQASMCIHIYVYIESVFIFMCALSVCVCVRNLLHTFTIMYVKENSLINLLLNCMQWWVYVVYICVCCHIQLFC